MVKLLRQGKVQIHWDTAAYLAQRATMKPQSTPKPLIRTPVIRPKRKPERKRRVPRVVRWRAMVRELQGGTGRW